MHRIQDPVQQTGIISESKESGNRQMASVSDVLQHETNPKGVTAYKVEFLSPRP